MTGLGALASPPSHETGSARPPGRGRRTRQRQTFASLSVRNFRLFAVGQTFSMTGVWMQRVAQDWLILSLTDSFAAVGLTTSIQCLPTLLLGIVGGAVGDRFPRRRVLLVTQHAMAALAGALAVLTLTGVVTPWHVYTIAFALGLVSVVDNPARQAFVVEMVGPDTVRNAIGINSAVFQLGGFIGPAMAGVTIHAVGVGAAFGINAVSYAAPIAALWLMRESELRTTSLSKGSARGASFRHVAREPQVLWPLVIVAALGLFAPNLAVTLAALTRSTFHAGPGWYGALTAVVAIGSVAGALWSARLRSLRLRVLLTHGAMVSGAYLAAAVAPGPKSLSLALFMIGGATVMLFTGANAMILLATPLALRGRAMGLYLLVLLGSATLGGPALGLANQYLGPRAGLLIPGVSAALAVAAVAAIAAPRRQLRVGSRQRALVAAQLHEGPGTPC